MSFRSGFHLFKKIATTIKPQCNGQMIQQTRNSGGLYSYRCGGYEPPKENVVGANILMGFMWWWILWHCWHEPGHILGEFPFPDPSKWTDEELGIPQD